MQVKDIDKMLDRRLVISLKQSTELFLATGKIPQQLPAYIYSEDGATYLNVFFPKEKENDQYFRVLFKKFDAKERKDGFVVRDRINNVKDLKIVNELLDLPSMVLNRVDVSHGEMHFYSRFHNNYLSEVSEILSRYSLDGGNTRIEWLGPSQGIIQILDLINSMYPISLLTYSVPFDDTISLPGLDVFGDKQILEVQDNRSNGDEFRTLIYSKVPLANSKLSNLVTISEKDMIYETYGHNKFLAEVRKRANSLPIIRLRYFLRMVENSIEANIFIPTNQIHEYYSILYDIAREEGNKLIVMNLLPYGKEIWDTL